MHINLAKKRDLLPKKGDMDVGETGIVAVYYNMLNELQMVYYNESLKSAMNST